MISEIVEEEEEESTCFVNKEVQKRSIRQIIEYQKSIYLSSSSSPSLSSLSSSSATSSANRNGRLLDLMKNGNTSLRRLFEMEHTSLATHFQDYSGSPITKTIPLWGSSETDEGSYDPWAEIKQISMFRDLGNGVSNSAFDGSFWAGELEFRDKKMTTGSRRSRLTRKKSFRRIPGFRLWRFRRFAFRLKRIRVMICGKIFKKLTET